MLSKAFATKAVSYHPDKGGDATAFAYIRTCYDVLCDATKRRRYDAEGKEPFVGHFRARSGQTGGATTVPAPPINKQFLLELRNMKGAHDFRIGKCTLAQYIDKILQDDRSEIQYSECELARSIGAKLRLTK